jgi:DNA-binding CsgD family transcriptional regulator
MHDGAIMAHALSNHLADREAFPQALAIVASSLRTLIGADEVLWTEINAQNGTTTAFSGDEPTFDPHLSAALSRDGLDHPAVQSYLRGPDDLRPRRVSDVVSRGTWLGSAAYANVFHRRSARYQMSIVTRLDSHVGQGWVLTRASNDFTDRELDIATALRPLLPLFAAAPSGPGPGRDTRVLTARETQIVALLDTGLTAAAIARRFGTSQRTVQKHLEHIYRKLGTNDRLATIRRARALGLLR